ncbi:MAG: TRAP transporter small permease subunit [Pseudomonadota bacterium]
MRPSPTAGPLFVLVDRVTETFAAIAAWLFVAAGAMLVFEVVARYVFVAPTVWAAELSLLCLIWATYMAAAALLRQRRHITITAVTQRLPRVGGAWPRRCHWLSS